LAAGFYGGPKRRFIGSGAGNEKAPKASLAADLGVPDHTISGLIGHKGRGMTSRYLHLGDKALLDAADLMAQETLRLMQRSPA
jgi:hypothetical protein